MASAMPPPANTALWVSPFPGRPTQRQIEIIRDRKRLELEDYRTINPARGPVRGYGRGGL
jgi:hypothetical protein